MKRRIAMVVGIACLVSLSYANDKDTYLGLLKAGKMPELKANLDG